LLGDEKPKKTNHRYRTVIWDHSVTPNDLDPQHFSTQIVSGPATCFRDNRRTFLAVVLKTAAAEINVKQIKPAAHSQQSTTSKSERIS